MESSSLCDTRVYLQVRRHRGEASDLGWDATTQIVGTEVPVVAHAVDGRTDGQ